MLLALDIGNTTIHAGVFRGAHLLRQWRLSTDRHRTSDEWGLLMAGLLTHGGLNPRDVSGIALSSVVPPLNRALEEMCRAYFGREPLVVGPGTRTGIHIRYETPRDVGADRIVNAVAAHRLYGGPVIVVDFGTATTFDVVSAAGEYLGGVIAPGIGISTEALFEHASKLPRVDLVVPRTVIGRNTVASMQSGIIYGFAGQVDGIVERVAAEIGGNPDVVATGGLAETVSGLSRTIRRVNPLLCLEGLRLIYELNAGTGPAGA
ncbi:MAG: type III pantothenate kinase [Firmicutes bacterium]|nr:type III pantothenate kinase [Bacillota bacterium]